MSEKKIISHIIRQKTHFRFHSQLIEKREITLDFCSSHQMRYSSIEVKRNFYIYLVIKKKSLYMNET